MGNGLMILQLRVVQGKPAGKTLVFGVGEYLMGRGDECHVRFNSDWVSRQHCLLRVSVSGAALSDLGSRNGTLINGRLCKGEQALADGDQVQVGPVTFLVSLKPGTPADTGKIDTLHPEGSEHPTTRSGLDSTAQRRALDPEDEP